MKKGSIETPAWARSTRVVLAGPNSFSFPLPSNDLWGSSSSVIKNTLFEAVLGAPSRMTQLQLVKTSPRGVWEGEGG